MTRVTSRGGSGLNTRLAQEQLRHVAAPCEDVGDRPVPRDREPADGALLVDQRLDRLPLATATRWRRTVPRCCAVKYIAGPSAENVWLPCLLSMAAPISRRSDPSAFIDPHVGVLHRRFEVGQAALRAEERDTRPVGRPLRLVLGALRRVTRRIAPVSAETATMSGL